MLTKANLRIFSIFSVLLIAAIFPSSAFAAGEAPTGTGPFSACVGQSSNMQSTLDCLASADEEIRELYGLPENWLDRIRKFVESDPEWRAGLRRLADLLEDL